ncbi:dihydrodipicolinate synthase family protein [Microbacterium saperdae]|uniref:Uncharacterized protein DUF993 n=1 Tax=Microbacterium saperdae TaxID=69368 RepID=A0A543BLC5_9MICO|nr:dihydrodipicolinate synthase family protein [Microbacterium saperdae]TQL85621.1 uncharacterized protein DUF993 [Microbacterium saperdae]GGM62180.1 hypothetical protein GCM10010489_37170 [Microbacterium saperdae]
MSTVTAISLPRADGSLRSVGLRRPAELSTSSMPATSRVAFAAGHVVADALRSSAGSGTFVDWDATLGIRHRLWDLGLGVAESMDTAQRGMGIAPRTALELGRRTIAEAAGRGASVVVGIATDTLDPAERDLSAIGDAYLEQLSEIEDAGGRVVLMASRQLAAAATGPDDYLRVYDRVLRAARRPVVLHWLGEMFDPALAGYWGSPDLAASSGTVLALIRDHAERIDGLKMSLLDEAHEVAFRRRLPTGVRPYTGDDFNYVPLIAGDEEGHSDALLGAFSAIPRFASASLAALDRGDVEGFRSILGPTQELSRLIFESPTQYYKVGVVWLSYLTGWQSHFRMIAGFETGRSLLHLARVFEAANEIGLFVDPDLAAGRATAYFRGVGVDV